MIWLFQWLNVIRYVPLAVSTQNTAIFNDVNRAYSMVHSLSKKIYDTNIEGIVTNLCKIILHVFVVMRLLQSICVYLTHIYLTQIRRPCKTSRYYTSIIKIFRHQTRFLSTQSLALLITSADSL